VLFGIKKHIVILYSNILNNMNLNNEDLEYEDDNIFKMTKIVLQKILNIKNFRNGKFYRNVITI